MNIKGGVPSGPVNVSLLKARKQQNSHYIEIWGALVWVFVDVEHTPLADIHWVEQFSQNFCFIPIKQLYRQTRKMHSWNLKHLLDTLVTFWLN